VVTTHIDGSQTFLSAIATCGSNLVYNGTTWSNCIPVPISLGLPSDQVVLVVFGTGIRNSTALAAQNGGCSCTPVEVDPYQFTVLYSGPQGGGGARSFYGLDQVNILLPNSMAGSGVISFSIGALAGYIEDEGFEQGYVNTSNIISVDIR
jgi:hypothetical protein